MQTTRRNFLKAAGAGVAASLVDRSVAAERKDLGSSAHRPAARDVVGLIAPKLDTVRWGFVGVGNRGTRQLQEMLLLEGCEVRALCDIAPAALAGSVAVVKAAGFPEPATYGDGPEAYHRLVERDDIDAVLIATPWNYHVPVATAAMKSGKHAFVEVPAATTIEDCWRLVETAEKTQRHCMMMENCCYGRDELMVLNMCRQGLFGELFHGEGSYLHDLRKQLDRPFFSEGNWRPHEATLHNGNLYPTHGLGPIAQYMGINGGDKFDALVSMSSPARGYNAYRAKLAEDNPFKKVNFTCGDMNTSIIKTALGRTIVVRHDTFSAMPYSRTNWIQGVQGIFAGYPNRIAIEGRGGTHKWDMDMEKWYAEFDHPLWKMIPKMVRKAAKAADFGHGGMDLVMKWQMVNCLRNGLPLDQNVYDAAAWSAIGPASEASVASGGGVVEIPDFTRGLWKTTPPLGIVS